jgi:hypothetical protein
MLEELKKYFKETSRDTIESEWNSLSHFEGVGFSVSKLIDNWSSFYDEEYI